MNFNINDNIKAKNLSEKIINSLNLFSEEKEILVFVKEKNFINLVNQILNDLSNYENEDILLQDEDLIKRIILENLNDNFDNKKSISNLNLNEDDEFEDIFSDNDNNNNSISYAKNFFDWDLDLKYFEEFINNDREYAIDKIGFLFAIYFPKEIEYKK
jgi:hypothetical protein